MYSRIVVPLDGSELSESALEPACGLSEALDAPIHLVRVVESSVSVQHDSEAMTYAYVTMGDILEDDTRTAVTYLNSTGADLRQRGFDATTEILVGPIAESLLAVVEPDELIVMCSRGQSGLRRLLLGSVAESVVRQSDVPVHLVKPTRAHGET